MSFTCPYGCAQSFPTEDELGTHGVTKHPGRPIMQDARPPPLIVERPSLTEGISGDYAPTMPPTDSDKKPQGDIEFCLDVILKEAKDETTLAKQLLYSMLSAYGNNPVNLAVNAPTGTGKTYTIMRVVDLFPKTDVVLLAGMTDKALFHRQGVLVAKNEKGEYQSIQAQLEELEEGIQSKDMDISSAKQDAKPGLKKEKALLQKQRSELLRDAKKLIDLSHKVLIFLDTPPTSLFAAMMPLLSHDAWEVEYDFVDTHNGIKTKSNVLRGWPAVIFAQAIDSSHHLRWPEIQRRFIVTNTKQSDSKIKAAIELTADKYGLPDALYQDKVVSDADKEIARTKIDLIRRKILESVRNCKPGRNNVFVPFRKTIETALPKSDPLDMTTANRFFTWLSLMPLIKSDKRPVLLVGEATAPIATFEDLKEALSLMEYANGVRPYVLDWYNEVFLPCFAENQGEVSTKRLAEWMKDKKDKRVSKESIRKHFCTPLFNAGYLDKQKDSDDDGDSGGDKKKENDKRLVSYSPVKESQGRLFDNNIIKVKDERLFPSKDNLIRWITDIAKDADILTPVDGSTAYTMTPVELVEKYLSQPDGCFSRTINGAHFEPR